MNLSKHLLTEELRVKGVVHVLGRLDNAAKWAVFRGCDILLLPIFNPTEGQPLTIIEAMHAGCVVVSTECGGLRDLVENGVTGRSIRPRAPEDIADALEYFWHNLQVMRKIAEANQRRAQERHSPHTHV
jgi:glycosyltransferase involved in cell wall biosynthesis